MTDPTKPVLSVRAALRAVLSAIRHNDGTAERADALRHALTAGDAALAAPFGLTVEQESKYTTCPHTGAIVNRATGLPIPPDEPIMIFRAKDIHAAPIAMRYYDLILETGSTFVDSCFERAQAFIKFRVRYPARMRKPD